MHLPQNLRLRIEAGHIDYVNEVRICTVLFLGFPGLSSGEARGAGDGRHDSAHLASGMPSREDLSKGVDAADEAQEEGNDAGEARPRWASSDALGGGRVESSSERRSE
ncbi:hypothetical protein H632_c5583p0, partial [Helicosporidium sp. ATCC 50920]